ncbi:MAG: NifB/NifX family molybdenum-iron cluster-binding protein [Bacteroidales bacterium]|nr:NifB/NifX family molybdenum-iron cluster-binding protein [Bacteroidales bacterium]
MTKKIAVPVNEHGILDAHFGHCRFFALLEVNNGEVVSEMHVAPPPHEPGVLPKWLAEQGVTDVIAGGMGQRAIQIFNHHGVNVFVGAPLRSAPELAEGLLKKTLSFTANYCDH